MGKKDKTIQIMEADTEKGIYNMAKRWKHMHGDKVKKFDKPYKVIFVFILAIFILILIVGYVINRVS